MLLKIVSLIQSALYTGSSGSSQPFTKHLQSHTSKFEIRIIPRANVCQIQTNSLPVSRRSSNKCVNENGRGGEKQAISNAKKELCLKLSEFA